MNTHKEIFNYRTPVIVFLALILLTLLTVATSSLALGETGSIMLAMFIASVKGSLVLIFFMHLNHEPLIFKLFVALTFVTLATLFVLTFADYAFRGVS